MENLANLTLILGILCAMLILEYQGISTDKYQGCPTHISHQCNGGNKYYVFLWLNKTRLNKTTFFVPSERTVNNCFLTSHSLLSPLHLGF